MRQTSKMNFDTLQKHRNNPLDLVLFEGDTGKGEYNGKYEYPFVLKNSALNLWSGIREEAIRYFNGIGLGTNRAEGLTAEQGEALEADGVQCQYPTNLQFWGSTGTTTIGGKTCSLPTGHILSSQVACINHLFPLIRNKQAATRLLHGLNTLVCEALPVDIHERGNFVEFEVVGGGSYLNEEKGGKLLKRGANCTSVDAVMKGRTRDGQIILFLMEWKYVEQYKSAPSKLDGKAGQVRQRRYRSFFTKDNSPFTFCNSSKEEPFFQELFTEPYYQLMRQTLLGWQMVHNPERNGDAVSFEHIIVIPACNDDLRMKSKSIGGRKGNLASNWNALVKKPATFIDPQQLLEPVSSMEEFASWTDYVTKRYWNPSCALTERPAIQQYDCIRLLRDVPFSQGGKEYVAPKGLTGCAVEVWGEGEAFEFDTSLAIPCDDGTLDYMFCCFPINAHDVEIAHSQQMGHYYPPKGK